jgi:oxygen-independent coproporphyrinogen-3 oxidase
MSGIYIHIPFCRQACIYCNFYFEKGNKNVEPLVDAILHEIELRQTELNEPIKTIYFGGGTPTFISADWLSKIMQKIQSRFDISAVEEITLEANPDDINDANLETWKTIGFNRLSIGVQSFFNSHLKWMNRAHNATEAENCIRMAKKHGFTINIDLIFGIPMATDDEWQFNLNKAVELGVHHLSCYGLTLEDNTPWKQLIKTKAYPTVNDDVSSKQFVMAHDFLTQNGFMHYEISNYALKNHFAKHNSSYWKKKKYLGIGPSAHSFNQIERSWNIADNKIYIESLQKNQLPTEREILSKENQFNELIMTSLRTIWGLNIKEIESFGFDMKAFNNEKSRFIDKNWLYEKEGVLFLTLEGMLYADLIAAELFV